MDKHIASIRVEAPTLRTVAIDFNWVRDFPSLLSIVPHVASNRSRRLISLGNCIHSGSNENVYILFGIDTI